MEFSLMELNELIYCVGTALKTGSMVNKKVANKLWAKLTDELECRCSELDKQKSGWSNQWPPMPTGH